MASDINGMLLRQKAESEPMQYLLFGDQTATAEDLYQLLPTRYMGASKLLQDFMERARAVSPLPAQPSSSMALPPPPIESPRTDQDDAVYSGDSAGRMLQCFSVLLHMGNDQYLCDFSSQTSVLDDDELLSSLDHELMVDAHMGSIMSSSSSPWTPYSSISHSWEATATKCCFCADGRGDFVRQADLHRHFQSKDHFTHDGTFPFLNKDLPLEAKVGIGIGHDTAQTWNCCQCGDCGSNLDDTDILEAPY